MTVRCGTKLELYKFLENPVWLEGQFTADILKLEDNLRVMVASPLLDWMLHFLTISKQTEIKMLSHDGGCCNRFGGWHDCNNYNYSVCWRLLCKEIITEGTLYTRNHLRNLINTWSSLHPSHQSKSNRSRQGDLFEVFLALWRQTDTIEWQLRLGGDMQSIVVASKSFHDGLHSLCMTCERLNNVFTWTEPHEKPSANQSFALLGRCMFVHKNIQAPERGYSRSTGAKKHNARIKLYRYLLEAPCDDAVANFK